MLRAPFSLEKTTYDAAPIYRSKLRATLKRNFQVMPGAAWLELLCKHVPDRHSTWCATTAASTRGAERERPDIEQPEAEFTSQARRAARAVWAKLIRKIYEVDPLECPKCSAQIASSHSSKTRRDRAHPHLARPMGAATAWRALTPTASRVSRSPTIPFPTSPRLLGRMRERL